MNLTKNERAALKVVWTYRRQVDLTERRALSRLAVSYDELRKSVRRDVRKLKEEGTSIPPIVRYRAELANGIERRVTTYAQRAEEDMESLARKTAKLGAETADKSARKIEPDRVWVKTNPLDVVKGPLLNASRRAIRRIPQLLMDRLENLVERAVTLGLAWLLTQLDEVFDGIWAGLRRIVQTLAEQMFRRAQHEQAERTPVQRWLRIANHETACFACLMLEGTIYDRREDFADHPNGRCTIVPVEDGHPEERTGREWFEAQDPETQRRILGPTRYEAWQNGDIDLDQLVEVVNDPVYGPVPHMVQLSRLGLTP